MILAARKHPLSDLTPASLARALFRPFVIVGLVAMLMLAGATVGLNPIALAGDFLSDAAVDLAPLAMRLLAIWAIYTTLYLLLAWDVRCYAPHANAIADPALGAFVGFLLRLGENAAVVMRLQQCQQVKYRFDRVAPSPAWSPGTHPQIE